MQISRCVRQTLVKSSNYLCSKTKFRKALKFKTIQVKSFIVFLDKFLLFHSSQERRQKGGFGGSSLLPHPASFFIKL